MMKVIVFQSTKEQSVQETKSYLTPFYQSKPYYFRSSIYLNNKYDVFKKKHFQRVIIDEGNNDITLLKVSNTNNVDNNTEAQTTLGITQSEYSTIKNFSGIDTDFDTYITLERITPSGGNNTYINTFGVEYSKYKLVVKGYNSNGNYIPVNTSQQSHNRLFL